MAFCGSCGKPTGPDDQFCKACGAPVKTASAAPPAAPPPGVAPAPPPAAVQQNVPQYAAAPVQPASAIPQPVRRSHVGLWLVGVFAILVLLVVVLVVILNLGPKPSDSLDQARAAYLAHDQANFDKYVDVNSVLSDWTDQTLNIWLKQQNAGALEVAGAQALAGSLKSAYLPGLSQSVDQLVVTGSLPDQSQNGSDPVTTFITGFLSSMIRNIASSQLTYQGVQSSTIVNNTDATLKVNVLSSLNSRPFTVQLRMRRDGDHWRVIAVDDIAGLLSQLGQPSTP